MASPLHSTNLFSNYLLFFWKKSRYTIGKIPTVLSMKIAANQIIWLFLPARQSATAFHKASQRISAIIQMPKLDKNSIIPAII